MTIDAIVPRQVVRSRTNNPFWQIVRQLPSGGISTIAGRDCWRPAGDGMTWDGKTWTHDEKLPGRRELCRRYSWAIPSPEALDWIVRVLDGHKVVEVGAGTGYWAWQFAQLRIDVIAYDQAPPDTHHNGFHAPLKRMWHQYTDADRSRHRDFHERLVGDWRRWQEMWGDASPYPMPAPPAYEELGEGSWMTKPDPDPRNRNRQFYPVHEGDVNVAARHHDRVLFLCWPPYATDMGVSAMRAYTGQALLLIGEDSGGCTGDDAFFDLLESGWNLQGCCDDHVQWDAIHDRLSYWTRRREICP